jgi:pyruvate dehydrogenase (quinone)
MAHRKVAELVIETLQKAGARRCYGIVGDTLNHVTDAIRRSEIEWVHVRHEEAAAFAAGAESYLTGELTVCAGSCGPGGLHFINGVFEANRNRAPVVLIASQIVTAELGMEFPQEVDFKSLYAGCSVFCEQVQSAEQAQRVVALAAQAALSRRGVAVVILPSDIAQAEVKEGLGFSVHRAAPVIRPNDAELAQLAALLGKGRKIAIYAGHGCEGAHEMLLALGQCLKAPIAHTSRAKDFVEYDNPFNMGMTGIFGVESGYRALQECDTLLLLGADFAWSQFYPARATILQIDVDGSHLGRRHPVALGLVGDIAHTIEALIPLLEERADRSFLDECLRHRKASLETLRSDERPGKAGLIHPQHLTRVIDELAADDAIFTADGGSPMVWSLRHLTMNGRRRTLVSLLHGTMANAMPQALGAQKAFPGRQVISLSGDGGIAMLLGDLMTAVQEKLPIKVVVYNNASPELRGARAEGRGAARQLHRPAEPRLRAAGGGDRLLRAEGGARRAAARCRARLPRASRAGAARREGQPHGAGDAAEGGIQPGRGHDAVFRQGGARRAFVGCGGPDQGQLHRMTPSLSMLHGNVLLSHGETLLRLFVAAALGSLVGLERERLLWAAGIRTHMLVSVGACLFMLVSAYGFADSLRGEHVVLDPSRAAAQVVSGIGFLGAGAILARGEIVRGLTTAASIWTVAAIGLAVGGGLYFPAAASTVIILVILAGIKPLEEAYRARSQSCRLRVVAKHGAVSPESLEQGLDLQPARLRRFLVAVRPGGELDDITVQLVRVSSADIGNFVQRLEALEGVQSVEVVTRGGGHGAEAS